jgi:vitamin B12 transporter
MVWPGAGRFVVVVVVLAAAWRGGPAAAEEVTRLEPVVVSATRIETPAEQIGGSVSVVTGEEIRTYHYPTIDEALRNVPGVEIRRSGGFGKTTSLTIRGSNANQVQVLVDGVRVKSPASGQADLSDLSPELIERIEIIRGPQSTLYGADAMGGVVNIITRKGRGPFAATVHQEAGTHDTLNTRATVTGAWGIVDYALSGSHLESNGQFVNDGLDQNAVNLRLGLTLPARSSLDFTLRWSRVDSGLPIEFVGTPNPIGPTLDPNTRQESETLVMSLAGRTRPVDWYESEARVGRYRNKLAFIDPPDPFPCPPATFGPPCDFPGVFDVERREAEWLNHFHIGAWSTSTIGLEYRHEEGDVQGFNAFAARTWTRSVFFQQQFRFFDRLFMSAGVRVEDNSVFGTHTTERGSLAYLVKSWGTRIRGSAGSGFRAPTFNDLFFPGFSNPDLQPEESFGYDFGVDQRLFADRVRLGLTYFQTNFKNLIACCVVLSGPPFVTTGNIGRARSAGIEFTSEVDVLENLTASLNYTYTDTENLATGRPLPREPRHRWNMGLTWEPIRRLSLFAQVHVVTRRYESVGDTYNSGHTRVDVGGTWRFLDRHGWLQALELTARIQNVLDERYAEVRGFPALGINGLVGLRANF